MSNARGFLGAGDLYISLYDPVAAAFLPYEGPYEAGKFEIKNNVDQKEMASKGRDSYGQVIESVPLPAPADFTLEMPEINKQTLTLQLQGEASDINEGAGTVTDEVFIAKKGAWVQLSKQNLNTAALVVTNSGATVTYVKDTDYIVNYRLGLIKILEGSAIADAASLKIDFGHSAYTGTKIKGARNNQIRARFILDGKNLADGLPCIVRVHEAVIAADTAFDFLASDFATSSLPGRLKTPVGYTEPFTVELLDNAI